MNYILTVQYLHNIYTATANKPKITWVLLYGGALKWEVSVGEQLC
jgi:hypothetical protein